MTTVQLQDIYCDKFDNEIFNSMYDIDEDFDSRPDFSAKAPRVLKALIEKGVTSTHGLWYAHNHFHVVEGEYVVTQLTTPGDEAVLETTVVKAEDLKDVVPSNLYFTGEKWRPVQYVSKDVPGAQKSYDYFLKHATEFLPDLTKVMKDTGLQTRMGLVLRNDTALLRDDKRMLSEKTDSKGRVQRFYWGENKEITDDLFVTYWCVDDVADSIKAHHSISDENDKRIIKVPCQRAHQVCAGWQCDG